VPTASLTLEIARTALADWLRACRYRQMTEATIRQRDDVVGRLFWWMEHDGDTTTFDRAVVEGFLLYCGAPLAPGKVRWGNTRIANAARTVRPVTVQTYYRVLRTFCNWLVSDERLAESPMRRVQPPVARPDQIQPLAADQVAQLLDACRRSSYPTRNTALVSLLLDTGLRAAEVCRLRRCELDMDQRSVQVLGKGNKKRVVHFGSRTAAALAMCLRHSVHDPGDALFLSERGDGHFTVGGLSHVVRSLGVAAGIVGVRVSPHTLRHTFSLGFIASGGSEFTLQHALGHTTLSTTRRYVDIARADLSGQMRAASPLDNALSTGRRRGRPSNPSAGRSG
jgi:integrase/recombinase XerD